MRTLDEIITTMQDCIAGGTGCKGCIYEKIHLSPAGIGPSCVEVMLNDALYYLKQYKAYLEKSQMDKLVEVLRVTRGEI